MNSISSAGVLIFEENKVLLVRHTNDAEHMVGYYGIPAGKLIEGQDAELGAIQKLHQETGLTPLGHLILLPVEYAAEIPMKDGVKRFSMHVFLAQAYTGSLTTSPATIPEWVDVAHLEKKLLLPNIARIVQDGLECYRALVLE